MVNRNEERDSGGVQGSLFSIGPDLPNEFGDEVGYRAPIAQQVAGITYRQLDYWDRTGLVNPSVRVAQGSGSQRLYSFRDILKLKIVKRLQTAGISLQNIRKAMANLQHLGTEDLAEITLVSDGNTVYECRSADEVIDLLNGGQGVFGIALPGVMKELSGTITSFPAERVAEEFRGDAPVIDELAARRRRRSS